MSVTRFTGKDSQTVMRKVRETFGPDAYIVSNREVEDGVEVLATANLENIIDDFPQEPSEKSLPAAVRRAGHLSVKPAVQKGKTCPTM